MALYIWKDETITTRRGLTTDEAEAKILEMCVMANLKLIKLTLGNDESANTPAIGMCEYSGFQVANLMKITDRKGVAKFKSELRTTRQGKPWTAGNAEFTKDEYGTYNCYIPDCPHNRKVLAACMYSHTADWEIQDEKIREDVKSLGMQLAKELGWRIVKALPATRHSSKSGDNVYKAENVYEPDPAEVKQSKKAKAE